MAELQLDPRKTALVLIDLQNAIVGMNPVPHSAAQVVENSKKTCRSLPRSRRSRRLRPRRSQRLHEVSRRSASQYGRQAPARRGVGDRSLRRLPDGRHSYHQAPLGRLRWHRPRAAAQISRASIPSVLTGISTNIGVESTARQGTRPRLCLRARRRRLLRPRARNIIASLLKISFRVSLRSAPPLRSWPLLP